MISADWLLSLADFEENAACGYLYDDTAGVDKINPLATAIAPLASDGIPSGDDGSPASNDRIPASVDRDGLNRAGSRPRLKTLFFY